MLKVTATELPRLMACNGSRLMGEYSEPENLDTKVRDEGNAAHWVVEQVHSGQFTAEELIDRKAPNGEYIEPEMVEYLEDYLTDVATHEQGTLIEHDTSFGVEGQNSWLVSGRGDFLNYYPQQRHLLVGDLKFGWGIVEPEENWTLIAHALGFMYSNLDKPVDTITLRIYQPRPHHPAGRVRSVTYTYDELYAKGEQIAETLSNPDDNLNTGEHCKNCPAMAFCPAARKSGFNAIEASTKAFVEKIDNKNLSFQLDHLARAIKVLEQLHKSYCEEAMSRVKRGQTVENYGIEHDYATLSWQKHATPEIVRMLTGRDDLTKEKLITPTQAKKAGVNEEVLASLSERKQKGFKLVRMDANTKAKKLFEKPTNPKGT